MPEAAQSSTPFARTIRLYRICSILQVDGGRSRLSRACLCYTSTNRAFKSSIERADTMFDRVKKANHPRGWDAKPRDLNRDGTCSRVSLAATQ